MPSRSALIMIGCGTSGCLVAVEILHEGFDAAFVVHLLALLDRVALVGQHDRHAGIQEGELAQPVLERREVEFGHGEGLGRGQERHLGAALAVGVADDLQRRHRARRRETPCSVPCRRARSSA